MNFEINDDQWKIKIISNAEINERTSTKENEFTHGFTDYKELTIYLNEDAPNFRKTLYHELTHVYMYVTGHVQWDKEFNNEDVCEISACSHNFVHEVTENYLKSLTNK